MVADLIVVLEVVGAGMLILSPFVAVVAAKARRARRRRRRGSEDVRTAAAWEEVVDRATDLGVVVPLTVTRSTQARSIDAQLDGRGHPVEDQDFHRWDAPRTPVVGLASRLDAAVFGGGPLDEATLDGAWTDGREVIGVMRKRVPRLRRLRATFSTRSLRRARRRRLRDRWRDWRAARAKASWAG